MRFLRHLSSGFTPLNRNEINGLQQICCNPFSFLAKIRFLGAHLGAHLALIPPVRQDPVSIAIRAKKQRITQKGPRLIRIGAQCTAKIKGL